MDIQTHTILAMTVSQSKISHEMLYHYELMLRWLQNSLFHYCLDLPAHFGDEYLWDIANTIRLHRLKVPPLYGVATDDAHHYHGGNHTASPGRGWIMVQAERLDVNLLFEAMERGNFYSSSGVTLKEIILRNGGLELVIENESKVSYTTQFIGTRRDKGSMVGEVFEVSDKLRPFYRFKGDELYVRAVVTASTHHRNPSFVNQFEQAWTQPVGWHETVKGGRFDLEDLNDASSTS